LIGLEIQRITTIYIIYVKVSIFRVKKGIEIREENKKFNYF
jgi:hypothetical protein